MFNAEAGEQIRRWLLAFFEYKNRMVSEDNSLSYQEDSRGNEAYRNIQDNQWKLQALIVRGRPGVGKTSAIRAVAKEMDIDLQECGSHYNQTKYLKEKN